MSKLSIRTKSEEPVDFKDARSNLHLIRTKFSPFTEVLGIVESVADGEITLVCRRKVSLKVDGATLTRWTHLLQPGRAVAILALEEGGVYVRSLDSDAKHTCP